MDNQIPVELQGKMGLRSDAGPRELNEDCAFIRDFTGRVKQQRYLCLGAVADGMGGHQAGEIASSAAIQTLFEGYNALLPGYGDNPAARTEDLLFELFSTVNSTVYDIAIRDNKLQGMGTTLTAFLAEEGRVFVAHVGDSRAYLVRGGSITQLSEDHTLVENMVKERVISREEAATRSDRNVITRAIGVEQTVEIDLSSISIRPDDMIMLCSDGLYGVVSTQDILITLSGNPGMQAACDSLVDLAIRTGASDNVTVLLWKVPAFLSGTPSPGTVRVAPGSPKTISLPPERAPVPATSSSSPALLPEKKRAGKTALIIAIVIFAIIGFIAGWLIAGWLKGDDPGAKQVLNEQEDEPEAGGGQAFKESVSVMVLNAKNAVGPSAAEAARNKLLDDGFANVSAGNAQNDVENRIYYAGDDYIEAARAIGEVLGIDPSKSENNPDVCNKHGKQVVVVINP